MAYYIGKVQFEFDGNKGKVKKEMKSYMVQAVSVTDAETTLVAYLEKTKVNVPFEVKTVAESKIAAFIQP